MLSHQRTHTSAHEVASPSSSRQQSDSAHEMLHNADLTLAAEHATLQRLQRFYEQHTFDTQGPYADLFAVLLSSSKHLIDINAQLVQHARSQEEALQRQQAMCDVLCGEAAQHKSDIAALYAGVAHVTRTSGQAAEPVASAVSPHASSSPSSSTSSTTASASRTNVKAGDTETMPGTCDAAVGHNSPGPHEAAWRADVERRLEVLQEHLSALLLQQQRASRPTITKIEENTCDPSRQHAEQRSADHSTVTSHSSSTTTMMGEMDDGTHRSLDTVTEDAVLAHLEKWKRAVESSVGDRVDHLAAQVTLLERTARQQQRRLQWMRDGTSDTESEKDSDADDATHHEQRQNSSSTTRLYHPRSIPRARLNSRRQPPPAVVQWLHSEQQKSEKAWRRVLLDVQEALLSSPPPPAGHVWPQEDEQTVRRYEARGAAVAESSPVSRPLDAAASGSPADLSSSSSILSPSSHAWFVDMLGRLLRHTDATPHTDTHEKLAHMMARTEEHLRDAVARLEVLEVYAPHVYATAARPPVLGVELADVAEPRAGVRVCAVYQGYLADRAGISIGDVICGVGHQSIHSRAQLYVVLAELTRDFNAQCRVQIEEGYVRHFTAARHAPADTSILTDREVGGDWVEGGGAASPSSLSAELRRARLEAAAARHRANGSGGGGGPDVVYRGGSPRSAFAYPASPHHKELLAECLPFFELTLHVVRDGRLRDVTLLVPPAEALRSITQY